MNNQRHDIVPAHLAVKAMRDNGYKNIAYAIAELIDNAIQAQATQVELLCGDQDEVRTRRRTSRIEQIAVLDNGTGMDSDVLRLALQFGNGTYLDPENHVGIGRFGMGLPSSSVSQCRRVEVWTWQDGIENAIYSYLDLDEIINGTMYEVPEPTDREIPDLWYQVGTSFGESGTLVVWKDIDRSLWRTSKTIIEKSEYLIGRIYRRFLQDDVVEIRFATFDVDTPQRIELEKFAKPNDPLYLTHGTSCPPYTEGVSAGTPMFEPWGIPSRFKIDFHGETHEVVVRYSIAKNVAREGFNPGSAPHGKHARENVGVSIMRADRELELDSGWSDPSEARDRWWGVEIDFPPALDDIFGVTNNKQTARYFTDLAKTDLEDFLQERSWEEAKEFYSDEEDPRLPLFYIAAEITKQIRAMRRTIRDQTAGKQGLQRHIESPSSPESKATKATDRRKQEGYTGASDREESMPDTQKIQEIEQEIVDTGVEPEVAHELAARTVKSGLKYTFSNARTDSPAFFDVKSRGGSLIITLNTNHPAYQHLVEALDKDIDTSDEAELKARLYRASEGLRLLLSAWARYEDEVQDGKMLERIKDTRWDWGRVARDFLYGDN